MSFMDEACATWADLLQWGVSTLSKVMVCSVMCGCKGLQEKPVEQHMNNTITRNRTKIAVMYSPSSERNGEMKHLRVHAGNVSPKISGPVLW